MTGIINGIDNWESTFGKYSFDKMKIHERNLEKILGKKFFVQPQMVEDKKFVNGISIQRFPEYYYCPECGALDRYYQIEKKESNPTNYNKASLNYAACHACSLLPETSCECSNILLDRGALIGTTGDPSLGYFSAIMQ